MHHMSCMTNDLNPCTFKNKTPSTVLLILAIVIILENLMNLKNLTTIVSAIYTTCVADFIRFLAPYIMKSRYVRI